MEKKRAMIRGLIGVLSGIEKFKGETGMYALIMVKNPFSKIIQSD
jgi:hypothetical protein